MAKLFRKTRFNLMQREKFGKYLRYAIGEIILVVIGILIALSINNWNQNRKKEAAEQQFFLGVKNDLKEDKAYINLVIEGFDVKSNTFDILNEQYEELYISDKPTLDSLLKVYFIGQRTFYPISGSFEAAVSGNEINSYRNKEVMRPIIKLYNSTYQRLIDNGNICDDRWAYVSQKYSRERRIGHHRETTFEERSQFLDDAYYHMLQMRWYGDLLKETEKEIDQLLGLIE